MHDSVPELPGFEAIAPKELRADRVALHRARAVAALRFGQRSGDGAARAPHRLHGDRRRPAAAVPRQVSGRPAVCQRRRRPDDRVPDRRHHREHHQQRLAADRPARRAAQPRVPLQGTAGRSVDDRRRAERTHHPHGTREAAGRRPQHPGRARRHGDRIAALGRAVPSATERPAQRAGGHRVADLRGAAAEAHRRAEEEAATSARRSIPRRIRSTCAGATSSTPGRPTASGGRWSISSARSSATRPMPRPTRASATRSARCRTTGSSRRRTGFPRAQAAAERATALDPELADAHGTLALGALFHRRNWAGGRTAFPALDCAQSRSSPACARSSRSSSPRSDGTTNRSPRPAPDGISIRCRRSST